MLFALSTPNEFCLVSPSEHARHAGAGKKKKKQAVIMSDCVLTWFLTSVNVRLPPGGRCGINSPVTYT